MNVTSNINSTNVMTINKCHHQKGLGECTVKLKSYIQNSFPLFLHTLLKFFEYDKYNMYIFEHYCVLWTQISPIMGSPLWMHGCLQ